MKDVFAIQSEIAQEIADSLQAKLSPAEAPSSRLRQQRTQLPMISF